MCCFVFKFFASQDYFTFIPFAIIVLNFHLQWNIFVVHFRFSATVEGSPYDGSFYFQVDNVSVAYSDGVTTNSNYWPDSSATINLHLTAGQKVQVKNRESTDVAGMAPGSFYFSWFTGFLLHTD